MKAALVLMIATMFWLMTPAISDAHKGKQHNSNSYGQHQDGHRDYDDGYRKHERRHYKAWKKHRKGKKHWRRERHHHAPVRVVYRERWSYPVFPGIVINIPL